MATQVQRRRGTTLQHDTFTGAVGEITVDTDKATAVVHDGITSGGHPLVREEDLIASNVSYTPAGTGAVATDVQSKLRESVSVKDFGAVGDGVTDDTVAIQDAIDSGSKNVLFPQGTYIVSANLTLTSSGVILQSFDGAVIKAKGEVPVGFAMVSLSADSTGVCGISFDGNRLSPPLSGASAAVAINPILGGTIKKITFKDCQFYNFANYGIYAFSAGTVEDLVFSGCTFEDFDSGDAAAVQLVRPTFSNIIVENCKFLNLTGAGFAIRSNDGPPNPVTTLTINGCLFDHGTFGNTAIGIEVQQADGLSVTGCIFRNARMGCSLSGKNITITGNSFENHSSYSIEGGPSTFIQVSGNTFEDFQLGVEFTVGASDVNITGNTFKNALPTATIATDKGWGIYFNGTGQDGSNNYERVVICGNSFYGCSGMQLRGMTAGIISSNALEGLISSQPGVISCGSNFSRNIKIVSNICRVSFTDGGTTFAPIVINGSFITVESNTCQCTNVSVSTGAGIVNSTGSPVLTSVVIQDNTLINFTRGLSLDQNLPSNTNCTINSNIYENCVTNAKTADGWVQFTPSAARGLNISGDADYSFRAQDGISILYLVSTLTVNRTMTLQTNDFEAGATIKVIRAAGGAFTYTVNGFSLLQSKWVEFYFNGTSWIRIGQGDT